MRRGSRRRDPGDDLPPSPEDEWGDGGEEPTSSEMEDGIAYDTMLAGSRRYAELGAGDAGWVRAKHVLRDLLSATGGPAARAEVGWVKHLGGGISRDIFGAHVELIPDPDDRSGAYVVLLPRADADADLDLRTGKELRLLGRLEHRALPFRVPAVVGALPTERGLALVRGFVRGIELDLRAGRQRSVRPWEIVGSIAAALHAVPVAELEDIVPGHRTRREHAEDALRVLDATELSAARAWAESHLPPADPSVVVHGDLLGQNILLDPMEEGPVVIDWEDAQRGDPAYDLAVVTRGVKQPFQIAGGLTKLLDAYRAAGGDPAVTSAHVRLHELCLVARWYRDALARGDRHLEEQELARVRRVLGWAQSGV